MPPSRKAPASDMSSSTISRPRGRPRKNADISLSSTVGAPTPVRRPTASSSSVRGGQRSKDVGNISLASTAGPSTPALPKKRGRPSRSTLTTPAMRALASADTSAASTSAAPRPRGRPPKSILTSSGKNRTITSPNNSVSFSDDPRPRGRPPRSAENDTTAASSAAPKRRGRPPKNADSTSASSADTSRPRGRQGKTARAPSPSTTASSSTTATKRKGRPPGSTKKNIAALGLPRSRSDSRQDRRTRPMEQESETGSEVSLVDGISDEESEGSEGDPDESDDEALSSGDEQASSSAAPRRHKSKKRKGWPSERERLRKWRRLSVEERECITSEGGLIWRTAIPLLNSMPKNIRSMVADSLTRALNRIDGKLESGLVPPLARIPLGSITGSSSSHAGRRDLASSMLSWRLEEDGSLLRAEASTPEAKSIDTMSLGMNAEIMELEQMLLPEAEQIVELSKTLEHQSEQVDRAQSEITKLKRERRLIKTGGTSDYPANLEAHNLISVTARKPDLDPAMSSLLKLAHKA